MRPTPSVRPAGPDDFDRWLRARCDLWPGGQAAHEDEIRAYFSGEAIGLDMVLVAEVSASFAGFAELSIRPHADGCRTPNVGYLEGWYVVPELRRRGVGRALIAASEKWALGRGCREFASDAEIDNEVSRRAHEACGFSDAGVIRCYAKPLRHRG